jgi:hypothetical protein
MYKHQRPLAWEPMTYAFMTSDGICCDLFLYYSDTQHHNVVYRRETWIWNLKFCARSGASLSVLFTTNKQVNRVTEWRYVSSIWQDMKQTRTVTMWTGRADTLPALQSHNFWTEFWCLKTCKLTGIWFTITLHLKVSRNFICILPVLLLLKNIFAILSCEIWYNWINILTVIHLLHDLQISLEFKVPRLHRTFHTQHWNSKNHSSTKQHANLWVTNCMSQ